jgi:hypothetical protein
MPPMLTQKVTTALITTQIKVSVDKKILPEVYQAMMLAVFATDTVTVLDTSNSSSGHLFKKSQSTKLTCSLSSSYSDKLI